MERVVVVSDILPKGETAEVISGFEEVVRGTLIPLWGEEIKLFFLHRNINVFLGIRFPVDALFMENSGSFSLAQKDDFRVVFLKGSRIKNFSDLIDTKLINP